MARYLYGGTAADVTTTQAGQLVTGATLTVWDSQSGGTQITDLQDATGAAATVVTSDAYGRVLFYGPDNDTRSFWMESNVGGRVLVRPAASITPAANSGIGFNVKDYGAVGDGVADDTAAINAALTAGAGGTVVFPEGTYKVSKYGANSYCLSVPAETTLTGPGTVKLAPSSDEWVRVFYVNTSNVVFDGLTIDGNKDNNSTHEHRHGITVTGATGVSVRNCRIVNCTGDGVLFEECTEVEVTGCHFEGHERNGVTLYADTGTTSTSQARITDNYINCAVQPVDSEPEGTATVDDVTVTGNTLVSDSDYGITLVSGSKWTVTGNTIVGGVYVIGVDQATIGNNVIDGTVNAYAENSAAVDVWGLVTNLTISGNTITTTKSGQKGIYVVEMTGEDNGIVIANNVISTLDSTAIECRAHSSVVIGNTAVLTTPTSWTYGIKFYCTGGIDSAVAVGNDLREYDIGIGLEAYQANDFLRAVAVGNSISSAASASYGIRLDGGTGGTHLPNPVVANNMIQSTYTEYYNGSLIKQGFYGTTPIAKPTVTGSRGGNAALASLCTALADLGLITNSTS